MTLFDGQKKTLLQVLIGMGAVMLFLFWVINFISHPQDPRSQATDTSTSKLSFKLAFKGVKPSYNCINSLNK
ncbi:MAG: hypothetical protein KIH89_004255, partial [Candidatus Shapirobacteria bacterium]|nr:hypothetical protein [Candidatus Shapirobacteria bacterium]